MRHTMEKINSDLAYFLNLPYTIEIIRDNNEENPGWVVRVVELPGCITQGDTFEELGEMIEDAMRGWIGTALENGIPIPEPHPHGEFSGKFIVRLPKSLHRELVEISERENVSLNAYISTALGKVVGQSTINPIILRKEEEPIPIFGWPKLSEQAQRILSVYGFKNEAQKINESMFAGWIEDHLFQIRTSLDQGDYHTALRYINNIKQSLNLLCEQSSLITTYCQVISLLEEQVEMNLRLRDGLVEQSFVQSRISAQTKMFTKSVVPSVIQNIKDWVMQDTSKEFSEEDDKQDLIWINRHAA
jgi:antitoxin HicB